MAEPALAAICLVEVFHFDDLGLTYRCDYHLGYSHTAFYYKIFVSHISDNRTNFAAIIGIYCSRRVGQRDTMFYRQSAARPNLGLIADGHCHVKPARYQLYITRRDKDIVLAGSGDIHPSCMFGHILWRRNIFTTSFSAYLYRYRTFHVFFSMLKFVYSGYFSAPHYQTVECFVKWKFSHCLFATGLVVYSISMTQTYVKICGLTNPSQAAEVVRLGADFIGLVFADSKRLVSTEQARGIVSALPKDFPAVGVFVDSPAEEINQIAQETGISIAQLHGDEPPSILGEIEIPCIKAFRIRDEESFVTIHEWVVCIEQDCSLEAVLLDAYSPTAAGGTGERFNWDLLVKSREHGGLANLPPIILAGGLDATNIAEAIRTVQPWAVDVSSGVESAPGEKDPAKIREFLTAVRGF